MQSEGLVYAQVVSYNNVNTILTCLHSLLNQEGVSVNDNLIIELADNNSSDHTADLVEKEYGNLIKLQRNIENNGFTGANNQGAKEALKLNAQYLLLLNPDATLNPDALALLVAALKHDPIAGAACPKLLRSDAELRPVYPPLIDSAGMYITPSIRHFDRGSNQQDTGQFDNEEYVFGASGAAVLFRQNFLLDVGLESTPEEKTLFDDAFFAYREDADLAWRSQWLGWECRYVPKAVGYHHRHVLPERRWQLEAKLNAFSVRNRFLLQLNNFSIAANWICLLPMLFRNLLVVVGCLTVERSSLGGLLEAVKLSKRALKRRKALFLRRRTNPTAIARWFKKEPYSKKALITKSTNQPIKTLQVIIINYNSGERLTHCLNSLLSQNAKSNKQLKIKITVFDNASEDSSLDSAVKVFSNEPQIDFERSAHNLGFAKAINSAVKTDADAILVLNPDIKITLDNVSILAGLLDRYQQIAAIAPVLINEQGAVQHGFTVRGFPTLCSLLAELFFLHRLFPNNPFTKAVEMKSNKFILNYLEQNTPNPNEPYYALDAPVLVDQPAASCLLIRHKSFQAVSGFDRSFYPAWFEDVDFCKRLNNAGFSCAVFSGVKAVHEGGYSVKTLKSGMFYQIFFTNMLFYWKKHSSLIGYFSLRLLFPFALSLRALVWLAKGIFHLPANKTKTKQELSISLSLLRTAFCPRCITEKQNLLP